MDSKGHILRTGSAGMVGSLLTSELFRRGYQLTVLDSLFKKNRRELGFETTLTT